WRSGFWRSGSSGASALPSSANRAMDRLFLENFSQHALLADRDDRRLALRFHRAPEYEARDQVRVALDMGRALHIDLGADAGIDAGRAGILQQRHLARRLRRFARGIAG